MLASHSEGNDLITSLFSSKKKKKEVHKRNVTAVADKTTSSDISEDEQDKIVDRKTTSDSTDYSKCLKSYSFKPTTLKASRDT